uniref:Squalene cyclase N-terminal domain-containing protein n=1 Tax=Zea mays TaxID=4577 RepID=A0A804PRL3_MAIZE
MAEMEPWRKAESGYWIMEEPHLRQHGEKFWLTVLGVYDWSGVNPVPPEFWLLPYYLPFHPGRMSCYCRMVYLPMSYIYGRRFVGPITPLVMELRKELYTDAYDEIDWNKARTECAKALSMLACWIEDPDSEAFKCHIARVPDYLWIAKDGMKTQIYDGSQVWDDAGFMIEALLATGLVKEL